MKTTYAGNGKHIRYNQKQLAMDSRNNLIAWSNGSHPTPRTYKEAAEPVRGVTNAPAQAQPTAVGADSGVGGSMTLSAIIDKIMQDGTDFLKLEREVGWKLEGMQKRMRDATAAERLAANDFRIPTGIMQVANETGEYTDLVALIDGCAAKHMASMNIPINLIGQSGECFRGATSQKLVNGKGVGNITVHTTEGSVSIVDVHQVAAMQPGQLIISVFQLLKTFGDLLGMSLKHGKMALFLPTSLASDTYRTRYALKWTNGLMALANVVSVTATAQGAVSTMGGRAFQSGSTVNAVHAVSSTSLSETVEPETAPTSTTMDDKCYERFDLVGPDTQLAAEANALRNAIAASLLDIAIGDLDTDMEEDPVPTPPPVSATASCSAWCDTPAASCPGRGRALRRQKGPPARRYAGPGVSEKRARVVAVKEPNNSVESFQQSVPEQEFADAEPEETMFSSTGAPAIPDPASSVDPDPAPAHTEGTVAAPPIPAVMQIVAAPAPAAHLAPAVTAAGTGAPVPYCPIGLAEQALIFLLEPNGRDTWERLNVSDVRCLYAVNRRMARRIGCWPWNQPTMRDTIPRTLFLSHYGWQLTGALSGQFLYNPIHRAAMGHGINPAFQQSFTGGQLVYENIEASMVTLQAQFRATQTASRPSACIRCVACRSHQDDDEDDEDAMTRCAGVGCNNGLHLFCGQRGSTWSHEHGQFSSWRCASCVTSETSAWKIRDRVGSFKSREVLLGNLMADLPHGCSSPATRYSTSRLPDITVESDADLPDLVEDSDDERSISHIYMVVSDFPDQRIHVTTAKGILDPKLHNDCEAIGHVVNCVELLPCGLAAGVKQSLPYGDIYANRQPSPHDPTIAGIGAGRLGNIAVRTPTFRGQPIVVNMYAQWRGGAPRPVSSNDTAEHRLGHFRRCLQGVADYEPQISSIAFPENIGCGLGGGDHQAYDLALRQFAGEHPEIRVLMVGWRDRSVLISNVVESLRACPRQPAPPPRGIMQVGSATFPSTGATFLVDACATEHMTGKNVPVASTSRSAQPCR
jgi:hypothetical protein